MNKSANDNPVSSYNVVLKGLHWVIALFILGMLCVGFYMTSMEFSPLKLEIYGLHKSFGMSVLMLAAFRILWRGFTAAPPELKSHAAWEKTLSKIIHVLLYGGMIGMPLSGWAMSSAGEFPNIYFGLFKFPQLMGKDAAWFEILKDVHEYTALALIAGVGLHMAGAFKHHFIDGDTTLKRMTSDGFGMFGAGILALVAVSLLASAAFLFAASENFFVAKGEVETARIDEAEIERAVAQSGWQIDHAQSSIGFTVTQYGSPFKGRFERFDGEIRFDPDALEEAYALIEIDITSIKTGSADRDSQALGADWFFTEQFPKAVFETATFRKSESEGYIADGMLTIRGQSAPLSLPFTLEIEDGEQGVQVANMAASISLDRTQFGVGQGQWADGSAIGQSVDLAISVRATRDMP